MAKLTQQEEIDRSRSAQADASNQDYICQTADNAETKKIFAAKSKTSLKSKTSKSPTKSSGRYGKGKKNNTSRLSQKSQETGDEG